MQIIVPKRYAASTPITFDIFLAGPVLGGGDWQRYFIEHFLKVSVQQWPDSFRDQFLSSLRFVVPCRWGEHHPLAEYFVKQFLVIATADGAGTSLVSSQTAWEIEHLNAILSRKDGFIVFGLFLESTTEPRTDGIPYATDTRGELGRWPTIAGTTDALPHVLIGAHPEFHGIGVVKKNLQYIHGDEFVRGNFRHVSTPEELADWVATAVESFYQMD